MNGLQTCWRAIYPYRSNTAKAGLPVSFLTIFTLAFLLFSAPAAALESNRTSVDVYLAPMADFSEDMSAALAKSLSADLGLWVKSSLRLGEISSETTPDGKQLVAEDLFVKAQTVLRSLPEKTTNTQFILLTNRDINSRTGGFRYLFSYHDRALDTSVVSAARMQANLFGQPVADKQTPTRLYKIIKRAIGEMRLGWKRSTDIADIMYSPIMSLNDLDRIGLQHFETHQAPAGAEQSAGSFVTVFDILESGYKNWTFPAFGLIFVGIGLAMVLFPRLLKTAGVASLNFQSKSRAFFKYFFLIFALLWVGISFITTYAAYNRHRQLAESNQCQITEGPVQNFTPMPYSGHAEESFTVSGVRFKYSDYIVSDGFNHTSSHGGPIGKDAYVRICYDPQDNAILRLQIRGFTGPIPDYAKSGLPFQGPTDWAAYTPKNPAANFPWYGNIFIVLAILDLLALNNLYLPYLRTFHRIATRPLSACVIPRSLESGAKVKLCNNVIFWDKEHQAIWLRPRGFNQFRTPLLAAKLNTDPLCTSILNLEIRLSSGFPWIMLVFLCSAYQFFSASMPTNGNGLSAAQFVGIAAVLFCLVGYINLKILGARLEKLVQDALAELDRMYPHNSNPGSSQ